MPERWERAAGTHLTHTSCRRDSEGSWDTAGVGAHDPAELRQLSVLSAINIAPCCSNWRLALRRLPKGAL